MALKEDYKWYHTINIPGIYQDSEETAHIQSAINSNNMALEAVSWTFFLGTDRIKHESASSLGSGHSEIDAKSGSVMCPV